MTRYEDLSYAAKAVYHVKKAEEYQAKVEALEDWADANGSNPELAAMLLSDPNKNREALLYKQAVGTRNGHEQRAIMYSLVALLEKLST